MAYSTVTKAVLDGPTPELRSMPVIELAAISKAFPTSSQPLEVVRNFSMSLYDGELVTFFGPNGCGKTTVLNMLAGPTTADSGSIERHFRPSDPLTVGYVFQNYADTLLPWRTVRNNIELPLEFRHMSEREKQKRVQRHLEQFQLAEHASKYIYELSGGLKQLVAIARATVYEPRLLLLDEPFSALDYSLSRMLWLRFREFWTEHRVTTVFVSHNVDEAVFLGDRVLVLSTRPTRVVADIAVPFGSDRPLSVLTSETFFSVRTRVLKAFEEGRTI